MMRVMFFLIGLLASVAYAQPEADAEIRQLQSQIFVVQQEQQSLFQQFQMLQSLRRDEQQAANPTVIENSPVYSSDNPPPNYDDMVRDKAARDGRIRQYTSELNTLYARYQSLEQQKQSLVARLRELTQAR
jgi:hypothetical protein